MKSHAPRSTRSDPRAEGTPRHLQAARRRGFQFGVAYYPEHWTPAEWRRDFATMARCGVKFVRMGEFAWDVWEPRRGQYEFGLFDEAIELAGRQGLRVILGTPTAAAPRWASAGHPEWLRHTADGRPIDHPGRQHFGLVHDGFRALCRDLTRALAAHYADHAVVAGWQIDNELHCVGKPDYSPAAMRAFQSWLAVRHRTIRRLNANWGTAFSAQTYTTFEEIPLPIVSRPDGYPPHPGHLLDFLRFTSDVSVAFVAEQAELLRHASRRWTVFHNGLFPHLNYWDMTPHLDILGVDLYPGFGGSDPVRAGWWSAFKLEQCRAHSGAFLVPELASGAAGSQKRFLETPEPGQMRLWAWQCVAHGAVGIYHFRWRTCAFGQEIYWHGVLDHDSKPRRRLRELAREGAEFGRIAPRLAGAVRETQIGVLIDHEQDDAHGCLLEAYPAPRHQAEHLLAALLERRLPAGLVHARDSFSRLKALVVPSFGHVPPDLARRLALFVRGGGLLVCTAGTGRRDVFNKALRVAAPGPLAALLGCTVEEAGGLREPVLQFVPENGTAIAGQPGYEILQPKRGTAVVARWSFRDPPPRRQPHPAHRQPAATLRRVGRGRAIALGVWANPENAAETVRWLAELAGWRPWVDAEAGVEASRVATPRARILFLLNHSPEPRRVSRCAAGRDLISGKKVAGQLELGPFGVAAIEERPAR